MASSLFAHLATDPTGSLAPGEVHIKSSMRNLVGPDGGATELIEGAVLVCCFEPSSGRPAILSYTLICLCFPCFYQLTRHPCKLPTDVQKVRPFLLEAVRLNLSYCTGRRRV